MLDGLTPNDTIFVGGYDLFLRRDGDVIAGGMKAKTCVVGEGEERPYSDHDIQVSKDGYWFRGRTRSYETDEEMESTAPYSWYQLERARWFRCMIDFPYEDGG